MADGVSSDLWHNRYLGPPNTGVGAAAVFAIPVTIISITL